MVKVQKAEFRISLLLGTFLCIIAVFFSIFLLVNLPSEDYIITMSFGIICWFLLWFFTHDLAHFVVGIIVGVRFSHYYLGKSDITKLNSAPKLLKKLVLVLGLKIDRANSKASNAGFAAMYLAGPLASMLMPFAVPIIMLVKDSASVAGLILLSVSIVNLGFTMWFSPKVGCIYKARKRLGKN